MRLRKWTLRDRAPFMCVGDQGRSSQVGTGKCSQISSRAAFGNLRSGAGPRFESGPTGRDLARLGVREDPGKAATPGVTLCAHYCDDLIAEEMQFYPALSSLVS